MRNNKASITLLNCPVLEPSDVHNLSPNLSPNGKQASTNSFVSGSSVNNLKQNNSISQKTKAEVKYFTRVSSNILKNVQSTGKFKKTPLATRLSFTEKKRSSAPTLEKKSNDLLDIISKYQQNRPTQIQKQKNNRFEQIVEQALQRQKQELQNPKQVDTDSDCESEKNIQQKKELNCFSIDDFEKGKLLGKGQFGQVFLVRHKQTGFICAMKIIDRNYIIKEKMQVQLAREIKLHSVLKHANINQMYGYSWDKDHVYLLLQLCSDGEVFKILKKRRRTSEKQASFIIKQMVQAVYYMHSINVIHRDLKPENMIMHEGMVKVIDFGWATDYRGKHRTTLCGTPLYYSPEMVKKQSYDFTVDLWAIGIMAYQLMIGNTPFSIWTQMQLHKIVQDQIKFPSYVDVSDVAKSFILSILHKDPTKRMKLEDIRKHDFLKNVDLTQNIDLFAEE